MPTKPIKFLNQGMLKIRRSKNLIDVLQYQNSNTSVYIMQFDNLHLHLQDGIMLCNSDPRYYKLSANQIVVPTNELVGEYREVIKANKISNVNARTLHYALWRRCLACISFTHLGVLGTLFAEEVQVMMIEDFEEDFEFGDVEPISFANELTMRYGHDSEDIVNATIKEVFNLWEKLKSSWTNLKNKNQLKLGL
ncbi:hypothetical protein F8M41_014541 [Gigaspora margarita]|uniref:Uncharacterized protein n=1 Tax=Gigaspora margarita TaxID=4874 RepID=A0A8H3WWH7_GIGMA|nr:hypothetical protein F8M41_014541 [Gigaspora margarita]